MKKLLIILLPFVLLTGCCSDQVLTNTVIYDKPELSLEELPAMKLKDYTDPKISQLTVETIAHNTYEMNNYILTQDKIITLYKEYYENLEIKVQEEIK